MKDVAKDKPLKAGEASNADELAANMAKLAELGQEVFQEYLEHHMPKDGLMMSAPLSAANAFVELMAKYIADPSSFISAQVDYTTQYLDLLNDTHAVLMGDKDELEEHEYANKRDRRFKNEAWHHNIMFNFMRQAYLLTSDSIVEAAGNVKGVSPKVKQKLKFYSKQWVDAMSPTNFAMTNPDVIRETVESNGENLVKGFHNLLDDLKHSRNVLSISQTDTSHFKVGENIAVTKGKVVFQNDLMQLIQYTPTTKKVHATPVLIISPWINKYYILDMRPDNSFVKWLVDQGHTVFITSWVNPDEKLAKKGFDAYMEEGALAALDAIKKATNQPSCNVIGYCLGGTLMTATCSYLTAKGEADRVKSLTLLTTLTDFKEAGDLTVFIDEEQVKAVEDAMENVGYFDGSEMAFVFSMLRANDLIWSFFVNNYLLGKDPFPFDLLYWNSDSTRLPAAMHSFYLRNMYLKNKLVKPGGIKLNGVPIDLSKVKIPTYMLSTREDHIAPWRSTFSLKDHWGDRIHFVLSASGHVAGVVNPPVTEKYCYWTNDKKPKNPDDFLKGATEHKGSWWVDWDKWIKDNGFAGKQVDARTPGKGLKVIEAAPGAYVTMK